MNKLYTKPEISQYLKKYIRIVNIITKENLDGSPPVKMVPISGLVGECLSYYLISDGIIGKSTFGKINSIELNGDKKSGLDISDDGYNLGGDIVIYNDRGKLFIVEIKSVTSKTLFTTKSFYNKNANVWVVLDFSLFRKGSDWIDVHLIKNMEKYSKIQHIDGNNQDKLNLKEDIERAKKSDDYGYCLPIHLENYLIEGIDGAHNNGFWGFSH